MHNKNKLYGKWKHTLISLALELIQHVTTKFLKFKKFNEDKIKNKKNWSNKTKSRLLKFYVLNGMDCGYL